ncbi:TRAP-type C4-dicarboxylate transport system, substrate-binding protein [Succinivibrio dextrinosolvens]|uniref:TRAP transporter substrate-binding protein DctP n=1 Tax=Succinivibrio dextrinosolvens TaxID=83771 RepID=UPI0008EA3EBF|nr:TRAP transporter substrate-binding protein DctP [Succinivibrio dextrinosolvens]SFS50146.1 TRAP-type C4-dicarboxylate transport system, substrate-binding protein [Succinivibrio dextrinosolvens]
MKLCRLIVLSVMMFLFGLTAPAYAKITVTVAHTHVETHPQHKAFLVFKNYIENEIGDRYEIQIYPNGLSGSNEQVFSLVKLNSIQFMAISASLLENASKQYSIFSVPYLFRSEESYEKFISDPEVLEELRVQEKKKNFRPLSAFTAGTRNFYACYPIRSVDDLKDRNFRVQLGRNTGLMMEAFGANDYVMSFKDVYQALKRGVVDGAENNELALVDQKHGEFCKYYTYDRHQMIPDMLVGSEEFLSHLSPEDYEVFKAAAMEAQRVEIREWKSRVQKAIKQAEEMGVSFIKVDVEPFRKKVLPLHDSLLNDNPAIRKLYVMTLKYQ